MLFNLKECIAAMEKYKGSCFWKNIYGSPIDCSGSNTDMMNENPEIASTWKGRILMQVLAYKTEKPLCISKKII
jgi:hypothetical protein